MSTKKREHQCMGKAKTGRRCGAAATAGGLCFFHANPNKASELGRIGGRSKRSVAVESGNPLPTLDSAIAVRDTMARLIPDVLAGKVHPRIAASLAPLMNLQLNAIKTADFEQRLAKLERQSKLRDETFDKSPATRDCGLESRAAISAAGETVDEA